MDLPGEAERAEIFAIHLKKRHRDPANFDLKRLAAATSGYSGAEIEQAVISALYDAFDLDREVTTEDILIGVNQSVPLSMTMSESIDVLREWAATRARPASSDPRRPLRTRNCLPPGRHPRHARLGPFMETAIEAFLANLAAERGLSPNTLAAYRNDLTQFAGLLHRRGIVAARRHFSR